MNTVVNRLVKLLILLLVITGVAYIGYSRGLFNGLPGVVSSGNGDDNRKTMKTARIERGDLRITVGATGTVAPILEVIVKSKASGEIISFPFEEGDVVTEGIVVVRLDPEIEKSRVNQAKANLIMAEAKLDKATISRKDKKIRLERQKSLYRDRIISEQELDDAEIEYEMSVSDIKIAEAEILRLKEALREAEDRLGDTEIPAPITGTILEKFVERGQIITSGTTSTTEGTSLFTMADLNKIYISASVDETDVGRVEPGQAVSITVDAYTGLAFEGRVLRIAPKGRVESTITVFDVIVEVIDREKTKLKPAMTANVEVLTAFKKNILLVPSEAVRVVSEEFGVYLMKGGEPMWVPLTIGDSNGISTEIQGDVKEGLEVIVSRVELGAREENAGLRSWSLRRVLGSFHKRR